MPKSFRYDNRIAKLLVYKRKEVIKILNWLYDNATIYLPRKYDVYLKIKSYIPWRKYYA